MTDDSEQDGGFGDDPECVTLHLDGDGLQCYGKPIQAAAAMASAIHMLYTMNGGLALEQAIRVVSGTTWGRDDDEG